MAKGEKKKRKIGVVGGAGVAVIALILFLLSRLGFGFGFGSGDGLSFGQSTAQANVETKEETADDADKTVITIKVSEDKIYYGGELCESIDDLKERITADDAAGATFVLEQEYAIKSAMDDVKALLAELEQSLDIKVKYPEK